MCLYKRPCRKHCLDYWYSYFIKTITFKEADSGWPLKWGWMFVEQWEHKKNCKRNFFSRYYVRKNHQAHLNKQKKQTAVTSFKSKHINFFSRKGELSSKTCIKWTRLKVCKGDEQVYLLKFIPEDFMSLKILLSNAINFVILFQYSSKEQDLLPWVSLQVISKSIWILNFYFIKSICNSRQIVTMFSDVKPFLWVLSAYSDSVGSIAMKEKRDSAVKFWC